MKICYVILHYKNIEDTVKCINSLCNTASNNSIFIVVDNGSGDGSCEKLERLYAYEKRFILLKIEENIGFSKGNNVGYRFAKDNYSPDYMVITNNDVVFHQLDFEKKIVDLYEKFMFDVLGPDIYVPRHNDHQSPMFQNGITIAQLEKELEEYKWYEQHPDKFNSRLRIHAFKNMLCSNNKFIRYVYTKLRGKDNLDYKRPYVGVGLQGACLIVSKHYINKEEKMFVPETFLYEEEVFLFHKCMKKGYKMVYSPAISVRHEEAAAFKNSKKNKLPRLRLMLKHHVMAREMLLDYLKNEQSK